MPNYSALTIHSVFEDVWSMWLRKEGESSALKAVTFFLKDHTKEDLLKACEAYVLENAAEDPAYTYKLSNFINMDYWLDVLEANNLDKLRAKRDAAIEVIEEWNKACQPHWVKVMSVEARIPLAQKALADKFFASNWRDALQKARKIFAYRFREGDVREKINLNFAWFSNVSFDKHVVLKIMEGFFGKGSSERIVETYKTKAVDYEARQKLAQEMKAMFPNIKFTEKPKEEKPEKEKLTLTKEAIELAEKIKSELGKKPIKQYSKNDTEKIVKEIQNSIGDTNSIGFAEPDEVGEGAAMDSESDDPFAID